MESRRRKTEKEEEIEEDVSTEVQQRWSKTEKVQVFWQRTI